MNTKKRNNKKGFTLMEILAVIAIVGILAAILIITMRTALTDAREKLVLSDMRNLQTRANMYHIESGSYGVAALQPGCDSGLFTDPEFVRIFDSVVVKSDGVPTCAVGDGGNTFVVEFVTPDFDSLCVDTFNIRSAEIDWQGPTSPVYCQ